MDVEGGASPKSPDTRTSRLENLERIPRITEHSISNPNEPSFEDGSQETKGKDSELRPRPEALNTQDLALTASTKKTTTTGSGSIFAGSLTSFFKESAKKTPEAIEDNRESTLTPTRTEEGILRFSGTLDSAGTGTSEDFDTKATTRTTHFADEIAEVVESSEQWKEKVPKGRFAQVPTINLAQKEFGAQEKATTAIVCTIACLIIWFITSSILLILFGVQYDGLSLGGVLYGGGGVDEDRARYVDITAERAAAYAAMVLSAGLAARDALDYAIKSKQYFEPLDYEAVRATLEPVFGGFALLRSVDLAFSDRDAFITMRRMVNDYNGVGSFMSMDSSKINEFSGQSALAMQSSAEDCAVLGVRGCLAAAPAQSQRWYGFASHLWAGEEADGMSSRNTQVFSWDDRPGFVPRDPSRALASSPRVEWLPAYSLLFRIPFPGSRGMLSLLGRSVIELSNLRMVETLRDPQLGDKGAIYICDQSGRLLAAVQAGTQVNVTPMSGIFRFQYIYELEAAWASGLQRFDGKTKRVDIGRFYVVVQPLSGRGLGNFSAVIAAERQPFIDTRLSDTIIGARVVVILPYPIVLLVSGIYLVHRERKRKRNARRVTVLEEGIETLQDLGEADEEFPDVSDTMTALRKRTLAKTIMAQREAEQSMVRFIEDSAKPEEDFG